MQATAEVMTPSRRKIHALIAVAATLVVVACSPTRPPLDQLDAASRALGAAREAGAATYAADDYRSAGQRFDQAQAAESRQDYDAAADLALESKVSSELAAARARLAKAREAVARLKRENADLDRDLNQNPMQEGQP